MNFALALSFAVNLMVGVALLLAWRLDREQRFSRDLGAAFVCQALAVPGFLLWRTAGAGWIGGPLLVLAWVAYLSLIVMGGRRLAGQTVTRRQWGVLVTTLLAVLGTLLAIDNRQTGVVHASLHLVAGVAVCRWLWRGSAPERLAGVLLALLGLNQFQTALGGAPLLDSQLAVATTLRVALGLTLLFAAFTRSAEHARRLHDRFIQLTERSHQGVGVMRGEQVLYTNPAVRRIYGVDEMARYSERWRETTVPENDLAAARERHRAIIAGEVEHAQWEGERRRVDGTPIHLRFSAWRVDWDGEPAEQVVVSDVTAEQNALAQLLHQATHDRLTGLPNRSALVQRLHALAAERAPFALVVLDIDRFALFNEAFGHSVGDSVVIALARALETSAVHGAPAEVTRLGEDEFALLARATEPAAAAARVTAAVRELLARPLVVPGHEFFLDVSMGVVLHPETARDPEALLRSANAAMHQAKRVPGISVQRAERRFEHGSGRLLHAEQALRAGLEKQQFFLLYQPKIDARTGAPAGFEALVRWRRGDEIVAPAEFIPAAENTGLIIPLGQLILERACAQLEAWATAFGDAPRVAVNVSPLQLADPGFPQRVLETIAAHGIAPSLLSLEITETAAVRHLGVARQQIAVLRERGIKVALDDFGVGFSSLALLHALPIEEIKIDRTLIEPLPQDEARAVVTAICDLGAALDLVVVAEGVETAAQADAARAAGCDQLQGYLVSRPLEATAATAWLELQHVTQD